jgi:hypothetical protein
MFTNDRQLFEIKRFIKDEIEEIKVVQRQKFEIDK